MSHVIFAPVTDESMKYLFNNGQSSLFKKVMSDWVSSPCDLYQISGALAIGNFARNGECFLQNLFFLEDCIIIIIIYYY